jgi:DNA-binding transcriptional MerR regulator
MDLISAPHRVGGQRQYSSDALDRVLMIRFATEMGFTLAETKVFLNGLKSDAPVGPRWKKLAHRKIQEVLINMRRERHLKSLLEHLLACRCGTLNICVQRLSLTPRLRSPRD